MLLVELWYPLGRAKISVCVSFHLAAPAPALYLVPVSVSAPCMHLGTSSAFVNIPRQKVFEAQERRARALQPTVLVPPSQRHYANVTFLCIEKHISILRYGFHCMPTVGERRPEHQS
jgi:hypothetical protein